MNFLKIKLFCWSLHCAFFFLLDFDPAIVERFHGAAEQRDFCVVVEMLRAGVPVDIRDEYGITTLHWAAFFNRRDVIYEMLKNGADVNVQDRIGRTPLHRAAYSNSTDAIKVLLLHGADSSIMDGDGKTPFNVARSIKREEVICLLEQN